MQLQGHNPQHINEFQKSLLSYSKINQFIDVASPALQSHDLKALIHELQMTSD